jgi:hypothetical protein
MSTGTRLRWATPLLSLVVVSCSSSAGAPAGGNRPTSPSSETGGAGGAPDASLGVAPDAGGGAGGGPDSASAGGEDAVSAADSSANSEDLAGGSDSAGPPAGFTCNLLVGPSPMMQWFDGGFLQHPGIDPAKWELIWVAHHYTDAWGAPGDAAWNTAFDKGHACAQNAKAPDRVSFMATQWSHTTAAQWEADLTGIVDNIKAKWPSVKRIELMASTSAPGDKPCPAAGGKNNETIIPQFGYDAIDAMPAKFPGLVFALPHFEVACSDFIGDGTAPQYAPNASATTGPAVTDVANIFGAYFAAHP